MAFNPIFAILTIILLDLLGMHSLFYRVVLVFILFVILPFILFDMFLNKE